MHRKALFLTVVTITCGLMAGSPLAAQPIPFALSGSPAPGGGNFGAISTDSLNSFLPVINDNGRVYFYSQLTGTPATAGLFAGTPGALLAVARAGSPAPSGGNYSSSFSDQRQNSSGQVAFSCSLAGFTSQGLFLGLPGGLQTVALTGNPAPAGGNYAQGFSSPLLNSSGQVAFFCNLTGGTSTSGIFAGVASAVQTVALQGAVAPGGGGNYSGFFSSVTLNASGQVTYQANLTGGPSNGGLFTGLPGAVQAVALQGAPAPSGGNYSALGNPVSNNAGQVAFASGLVGGSSTEGVFRGAPGSLQTVALQGTPAPAGGNYTAFFSPPVLNGAGMVAFEADLTGGTATSGIFIGTPGSMQSVALQGMAAPGGGLFSTFGFPPQHVSPQLNGLGQVAFFATLTGPGITTSNNQGIYAGLPGSLVKVIQLGDQIDVDPGPGTDLRTVSAIGFRGNGNGFPSGGQDGRGIELTDNGLICYTLAFTDGSSGVFFSSLNPVPEPTSIALLVVLTLGYLTWLCRRSLAANEPAMEDSASS